MKPVRQIWVGWTMILGRTAVACIFLLATGTAQAQQKNRIALESATYGVSYERTLEPEFQACNALDVAATAKRLCNGKTTCRIPIANQTFGNDPCVKANKELRVSWSCDGKGEDMITGSCREYQQMTLICPPAGARWDQASICTDDDTLDKDP